MATDFESQDKSLYLPFSAAFKLENAIDYMTSQWGVTFRKNRATVRLSDQLKWYIPFEFRDSDHEVSEVVVPLYHERQNFEGKLINITPVAAITYKGAHEYEEGASDRILESIDETLTIRVWTPLKGEGKIFPPSKIVLRALENDVSSMRIIREDYRHPFFPLFGDFRNEVPTSKLTSYEEVHSKRYHSRPALN